MIYIIRHGQTEKNREKVLQGRSNTSLNEIGRNQAGEARERFEALGVHFDKVYCSPLSRAIETAQIIAGEAERVLDERLIEMDYGPYEGMSLNQPAPEVLFFFKDFAHHPAPKGMEPLKNIIARLGEFMEDIREEAQNKTILLSTHAIAMKGALEYLTPESEGSYWSKYVGNCEVYRIEALPDGKWKVMREDAFG